MDKYKNGKIYTIRNRNDDSLIYVGSTVVPLYKRLSQHKLDSKRGKNENRQLYIKMNETDINDWYIELYEDCPCEWKEQLNKREGQVIREIGTLNTVITGRTPHEWYQDNKDKKKEYYQANKEKIKEYKKEWEEANKELRKVQKKTYKSEIVFCECGCSVCRNSMSEHKRTPKHEMIMREVAKKEILDEQI